jgi:hypothetical protein
MTRVRQVVARRELRTTESRDARNVPHGAQMFLDRLAIAGMTWTARTALSLGRTRKPSATTPKPTVAAAPQREENRYDAAHDPAETQQVLAPDQDLLEAMNIEESMGYQGDRR